MSLTTILTPDRAAAFAQMIDMGWTDALRTLHPEDPSFTFWSYLRNRWTRDAGLRLDNGCRSVAASRYRLWSTVVPADSNRK